MSAAGAPGTDISVVFGLVLVTHLELLIYNKAWLFRVLILSIGRAAGVHLIKSIKLPN